MDELDRAQSSEATAVRAWLKPSTSTNRCACNIAISTCAGRSMQHNLILRHQIVSKIREFLERARFRRDRNADPDQEHAGGRPRLPGAEPALSGRLLRLAAVATATEATADGERHGSLLPDRALLPRRGPARRPSAGIHAARSRNVVRRHGRHPATDRRRSSSSWWKSLASTLQEPPFPRLTYAEAMWRYGSDKPDLRFGLEIADVSALVANSEFGVFKSAVAGGGVVRAIGVPAAPISPAASRRTDGLRAPVRRQGARLAGAWKTDDGALTARSPIAKFLSRRRNARHRWRTRRRSRRPACCSSPTPRRGGRQRAGPTARAIRGRTWVGGPERGRAVLGRGLPAV